MLEFKVRRNGNEVTLTAYQKGKMSRRHVAQETVDVSEGRQELRAAVQRACEAYTATYGRQMPLEVNGG